MDETMKAFVKITNSKAFEFFAEWEGDDIEVHHLQTENLHERLLSLKTKSRKERLSEVIIIVRPIR